MAEPSAMEEEGGYARSKFQAKVGSLFMIRGMFNSWRPRYINIIENFLTIAKKPQDEKVSMVDLRDYIIRWEGNFKKKFAFTLDVKSQILNTPKKKNSSYKRMVFGDSTEIDAKRWYEIFRVVVVSDI
jgi:hypothetical protein